MVRIPLLCLAALLAACSETNLPDEGTVGSGAAAPVLNVGEAQQAYSTEGPSQSCDATAEALASSGTPAVTVGGVTLYGSYEQKGNNQNPLLFRVDDGAVSYCKRHESEGPDGRLIGLTWDGSDYAYALYTIDGGGSSLEGQGGWLSAYAPGAISGGGPKVSVIARIEVASGDIDTATFVIALTSKNKVNTHRPDAALALLEDGTVVFSGDSRHKPIDSDGRNAMDCDNDPFTTRYEFSADLTQLICAESTNCRPTTPCN